MRNLKFSFDEYYHLYNRGVDKRIIFLDDRDKERFLCLMFLSNSEKSFEISKHYNDPWSLDISLTKYRGDQLVSIGAWVIMPNHFHILLREKSEGGVSKFMHKLTTGYVKYFNKKYHRTGSLFEGRFKATHADTDRYLKYLYSYIHLNPIGIIDSGWKKKQIENKEKAKEFMMTYKFSSLLDYFLPESKTRLENKILNKDDFPNYRLSFNQMILEWINFDNTKL